MVLGTAAPCPRHESGPGGEAAARLGGDGVLHVALRVRMASEHGRFASAGVMQGVHNHEQRRD